MGKTDNKLFDEFAKMATGAVSAFAGVRGQIQSEIKTQINRFIAEMDFVPRDDFEIVESMAREARIQNEKLATRIAELEAHLGLKPKAKAEAKVKKAAKKAATPKKKTTKTAKKK